MKKDCCETRDGNDDDGKGERDMLKRKKEKERKGRRGRKINRRE
jgi:hypothetical protein